MRNKFTQMNTTNTLWNIFLVKVAFYFLVESVTRPLKKQSQYISGGDFFTILSFDSSILYWSNWFVPKVSQNLTFGQWTTYNTKKKARNIDSVSKAKLLDYKVFSSFKRTSSYSWNGQETIFIFRTFSMLYVIYLYFENTKGKNSLTAVSLTVHTS